MANEDLRHLYLLEREAELWRVEGSERAQDRLDDLEPGSPEAVAEEAWQNHCQHRRDAVGIEIGILDQPRG